VGLVGTVFTMRESFFRNGLKQAGIETLTPEPAIQPKLKEIIFGELCRGEIRAESRRVFERMIDDVESRGAGRVVLGCTEIPLIARQENCRLPFLDTTALHRQRALEMALSA